MLKSVIAKRDNEAQNNDAIYLVSIDRQMPNKLLEQLLDKMEDLKSPYYSKYSMYRGTEDFLIKTEWFCELPEDKKFRIRHDFYDAIIRGVHFAFCRQKQNPQTKKRISEFEISQDDEETNTQTKSNIPPVIKNLKPKMDQKHIEKAKPSISIKELIILSGITLATSIELGFYFKIPNQKFYFTALQSSAEWKRNDYLNYLTAKNGFFGLEDFNFNWAAFVITFLTTIILFIFLKKPLRNKVINYFN
ncbi:hypothetical protein V8G61_10325 [Gaetbulibacter sp. M240]|uniref:hypothetical protein n=1 Tax=Gaetbulibacter sp. M240 TaxID=3126511 RepID=UPI00374F7A9B